MYTYSSQLSNCISSDSTRYSYTAHDTWYNAIFAQIFLLYNSRYSRRSTNIISPEWPCHHATNIPECGSTRVKPQNARFDNFSLLSSERTIGHKTHPRPCECWLESGDTMENITFVTGNAKKLAEVNHILGDKVQLKSRALDCTTLSLSVVNIS